MLTQERGERGVYVLGGILNSRKPFDIQFEAGDAKGV
jgi:hypothetical protein